MNTMGKLMAVVLMCAVASVNAREVRLHSGMPVAVAELALGGIAIQVTPLPDDLLLGAIPDDGSLWILLDLDLVVMLYSNDGVLTAIGYWSKPAFGGLSGPRLGVERRTWAIFLDTGKHSVEVK